MEFGVNNLLIPSVQCIGPEDLSEGASTSPWISLADHRLAEVHILIGDLAGATSAVTLLQATDVIGTGSKTLAFSNHFQYGQRVNFTGRSPANFTLEETITGGTSGNTAVVKEVSSDHLYVATLTGSTTWTDTEEITGGSSGATADVSGTGTYEDTPLKMTTTANTFNTLAVTFKHYAILVDDTMLDGDNDFDHFQVLCADASAAETQGVVLCNLSQPRIRVYPAISAIGAQKTD